MIRCAESGLCAGFWTRTWGKILLSHTWTESVAKSCLCDHNHLKGSDSWTSSAAPRILPSFRAWARAFSSTRPPRAELTRKAPWRICTHTNTQAAQHRFLFSSITIRAPGAAVIGSVLRGRTCSFGKTTQHWGKTNAFQIQSDKLTKGLSKCPNDTNPSIYTEARQGLEETSQEEMMQMNVHCIYCLSFEAAVSFSCTWFK